MNFLGAVAFFLSAIVLAEYCFVTLGNTLLGIAAVAIISIGFFVLILTARGQAIRFVWLGTGMFLFTFVVLLMDYIW